jgi:KaiC/GvpD/RAD55 family RecA-like ATPase
VVKTLFRDAIDGLENVLETEVPKKSIILVTGTPGSLKSGFTYNTFSSYLKDSDECGIYVTLEESTESHLRNMESLGIDIPENLFISDHTDIRKRFEDDKKLKPDLLRLIEGVVTYYISERKEKLTCFALDSLNALYSLVETSDLRIKLYHFFQFLRNNNLTSIVISEIPEFSQTAQLHASEGFLVDGLIRMGEVETQQDIMLYLQVKKMRATVHSRKKHLIEVGGKGLMILGPIFD